MRGWMIGIGKCDCPDCRESGKMYGTVLIKDHGDRTGTFLPGSCLPEGGATTLQEALQMAAERCQALDNEPDVIPAGPEVAPTTEWGAIRQQADNLCRTPDVAVVLVALRDGRIHAVSRYPIPQEAQTGLALSVELVLKPDNSMTPPRLPS